MNRRSYAIRLLILATLVTITAVTITARKPTDALARRDVFADELAASRAAIPLPAAPATRSTSQGVPVAVGGMRASFDPESGGLGTLSALPPLTEAEKVLREPTQPSRQVVMPDGSVMVELNGSCQEFMVLQIDARSRSVQCIQDPKKALLAPAPAAAER